MKTAKLVAGILLAILVIIQVIPARLPDNDPSLEHDMIMLEGIGEEEARLLKAACYDCHSNQTVYPWYSYVAPVSWLVVRDVKLGRETANYSDWGNLDRANRVKLLTETAEEIESGSMPMPIYSAIHRDARLSDEERQLLISWTENQIEKILEQ
jgi:hypothetical protein